MAEAARVTDPVIHTSALAGFLVGAVLGIALIVTVAILTFTCGFGVALLAGFLAGMGAQGLLALGEAIGRMFTTVTGTVVTGSPDVFINNLPAAFTISSTVACCKDVPGQVVADGSSNVFIDTFPAARKGDHATCDAKIDKGSEDVFIGGGTVRYLPVSEEIPEWLRTAVDWAFTLASLVGGLVGMARQMLLAGGKLTLRAFAPCAAKFIAGFVMGEMVSRYVVGPAVRRVIGGLVGNPVDVTNGRKLLLAQNETDFVLWGRLPLACSRFYSSDVTGEGALGRGWVLPWEIRLEEREGQILYTDVQGRQMIFPWVEPGHSAFSEVEGRYLACTRDGRYVLYDLSETYREFGPLERGGTAFLRRVEDQAGQWQSYERDSNGCLVAILTSSGQQVRLHYAQHQSRLLGIELVKGGTPGPLVSYDYDEHGQLASVTDAAGRVTRRFKYAEGCMVLHTDALGFECRYRWEKIGGAPRVVEHTTSEGERYIFRYDLAKRETWAEDDLGRKAHWRYDEHRQIVECTDFDGGKYQFEYTEAGNPAVLHLPGERIVRLEYDDLGRLVQETDPLGRVTKTAYHGKGLRVRQTEFPDGSCWRADYDVRGLITATTDALGRTQRYEYGSDGLPHSYIDARGGHKHMKWNTRGQITAYTDCSGKTTQYEYDTDGNLSASIDAAGIRTTYRHQRTGEITEIVLPDGSADSFEYDQAGQLVSHRNGAGYLRQWQYNARGQIIVATDAAQRTLRYFYDAHGRLAELANANNARYRFEYDVADRLACESRPDGVEKHFHYDAASSVVEVETLGSPSPAQRSTGTGKGSRPSKKVCFERDLMGRLLAKHTDTASTSYEWDVANRLLEARQEPTQEGQLLGIEASCVRFEYDAAGRLIAEHGANGVLRYELDELDNLAALTLPQGQRIDTLTYGSGHVHQIRMGDRVISDFERDDLHREILRTQGRISSRIGYDALGRRSWQSAGHEGQAVSPGQGMLWRSYQYDRAGELAAQQDSLRGEILYQYDPTGLLKLHTRKSGNIQEQFAWDAAGNLLDDVNRRSTGLVQDNRLRVWQDLRFEYDPFGNLAIKRKGPHQEQSFAFDAEDRLIAVHTKNPWSARGAVETRFSYDALGRRISRTEIRRQPHTDTPFVERSCFVWQGLRLVQELRAASVSTYLYNPDTPYSPLARIDQPLSADGDASPDQAQVFHFHTDAIGTPLEVTDEDGEIAWAGRYKAWGKVERSEEGIRPRIEQPLRFPGQYADASTSLHYNTFRYYDPDTGRFLTQDPVGLEGGENLYEYAPNPTMWADPLGLAPWPGHLLDWMWQRPSTGQHMEGIEFSGSDKVKPGKLNFSQQLDVHTEAKVLAKLEGSVQPGDKLYFRGTKDPCNPGGRGCFAKMSDFAKKHGVEITYENKTTGKTQKFGC